MSTPVPVQPQREPGSTRLVLAMALAGLLAGIIIIGVYEATLPTIEANRARELREAVFQVLPGVRKMQALRYDGRGLVPNPGKADDDTLYAGYDGAGRFIGYAIPAEGPGFQDTIKLLYGYLPRQRRIVGMAILDSRETPGLGDKIYKDADFVANFDDLAVDPEIVAVKKGTSTAPNQIDAITGATISSKAVVRIINRARSRWEKRLPAPGSGPAPDRME
ncbi:MAG TPA: FMN-binding protein [Sedimenticola thiotaurini]|uniref:Ion-translocating oxidoreductase complex subunit G n=1 Tax=Sedimenticola thiotaurini TaxID=1543721 RepID=A0A831RJG1_9GAMM|nr:FMN-binding protein [Sedimenticola thiotaurini]